MIELLKDIGCDQMTIEKIIKMQEDGNDCGVLRILVEHRKRLLNLVHKCEKQISCLDYYLYCLKKESAKK